MNLAEEIQKIEKCSALTSTTKEAAIKEIIEDYRHKIRGEKYKMEEEIGKSKKLVKIIPPVDGAASEREYNPAIEDVISGKTHFMDEYKKLGPLEFILAGNGGVTGGDKNMEKQIKFVDETILRLYIMPTWSSGEDYWC